MDAIFLAEVAVAAAVCLLTLYACLRLSCGSHGQVSCVVRPGALSFVAVKDVRACNGTLTLPQSMRGWSMLERLRRDAAGAPETVCMTVTSPQIPRREPIACLLPRASRYVHRRQVGSVEPAGGVTQARRNTRDAYLTDCAPPAQGRGHQKPKAAPSIPASPRHAHCRQSATQVQRLTRNASNDLRYGRHDSTYLLPHMRG